MLAALRTRVALLVAGVALLGVALAFVLGGSTPALGIGTDSATGGDAPIARRNLVAESRALAELTPLEEDEALRVISSAGPGIEGANVVLHSAGLDIVHETDVLWRSSTDSLGRVQLTSHTCERWAKDESLALTAYAAGFVSEDFARGAKEVALSPGGSLHVTVSDIEGRPIPDVLIGAGTIAPRILWFDQGPGLTGSGPAALCTASTDEQGEASLGGLSPGRYFVAVGSNSLIVVSQEQGPFEVEGGKTTLVNIEVARIVGAALTLEPYNASAQVGSHAILDQRPIWAISQAQARVAARFPESRPVAAFCTVPLRAGEAISAPVVVSLGTVSKTVNVEFRDVDSITAPIDVSLELRDAPGETECVARLVTPSGIEISGIKLILWDVNQTALTRDSGRYLESSKPITVRPGRYRLESPMLRLPGVPSVLATDIVVKPVEPCEVRVDLPREFRQVEFSVRRWDGGIPPSAIISVECDGETLQVHGSFPKRIAAIVPCGHVSVSARVGGLPDVEKQLYLPPSAEVQRIELVVGANDLGTK